MTVTVPSRRVVDEGSSPRVPHGTTHSRTATSIGAAARLEARLWSAAWGPIDVRRSWLEVMHSSRTCDAATVNPASKPAMSDPGLAAAFGEWVTAM